MTRILITGSLGQIGSELSEALAKRYGKESIVVSDIRKGKLDNGLRFRELDVRDSEAIAEIIKEEGITDIFHLAAILSASGEKNPNLAYDVNSNGTFNVLSNALACGIRRVIIPSTIGVFGPETPKEKVPEVTVQRPTTMYGITKVAAELLGLYFRNKHSLDVRGLRFPGLISYKTPPTAGTTDYAVDMIMHAARGQNYQCYLRSDTRLPMMYMPDAIEALIKLFESNSKSLRFCMEYNVSAFSFTPAELEAEIRKIVPDFRVSYLPDFRQDIADSWPNSLECSAAKKDWGFHPKYSFTEMVHDMMRNLRAVEAKF
ncbi:MAG TPA: NAD-dependent epimerase/dehydratase family protein [Thermoplasmataceae archaeon]|nr:NAD-dependent epimerase/dehydratase family protein [Thermoplasmataceae archaeon]